MKTKIILLLILPLLWSCTNDDEDYTNLPLEFKVPSNFPPLAYNISNNPPTQKGFELGKKLFYDGRLASDGVVSCGFCHIQENAFTHHGHTFSHGVNDAVGTRNTPSIQNLGYQTAFMWDGAVNHLDLQSILPFTNPVEMNGDFSAAITMMKGDAEYQKLYKLAFADGQINSENMLKALGQFMLMVTSSNSRFDKYRRNEAGGTLTQQELSGYAIFNQKCASCHATDLFTDNSFRNNGLSVNPALNDVGRYRVTELDQDLHKFKVPSLRNIEKTAPYMHDGRLLTLEGVLDHYSSEVVDSATLDPILKQNGILGIALSATEKSALIAFLKTLTDNEYLTDKRFSEY
ncbi:cytochrome-c peroxidase [Flavobacterium branchiophilum]|uniref:Cytochrome c peroxidase n=1 Tax=Flavobacterium branchiophilum TaxID=55197 RepID=A0A543G097_9FLAO|nr:cytochrome c peroxidase [Flavobacterium branchiophilum]OXA75907.1 cytochrome-c peroxidase [Flavobacterium branchiophilum] [Flavobacterium branchiophilum NBRC 15030 = ATCC 35035]TQM39497.1 cytochrome c peroxidase [Flavobacterium branchiophilum]GEM54025.1 cytochrome-c peroxidase [Flavobacterium branchiophilum NBRC 15030 = ATCC 35035]